MRFQLIIQSASKHCGPSLDGRGYLRGFKQIRPILSTATTSLRDVNHDPSAVMAVIWTKDSPIDIMTGSVFSFSQAQDSRLANLLVGSHTLKMGITSS